MAVHDKKKKPALNFYHVIKGSSSWKDIYTRLVEFNQQGDPRAGYLFEQFCKYYFLCEPSEKDEFKHVWHQSEIPLKIKRKLTLAKKDYGIDLVLQDRKNLLYAVQCKFKTDETSSLGWGKDKLAHWLSEADEADGLILFTNASKIDKHAEERATRKDFRLYTAGNLTELSKETILKIIKCSKGLKPKKRVIAKPRPYQKKAITEVLEGFKKHDRGQLIFPCGAGKTLTSLWIKERLKTKRTLVLVPSLALLRQIKKEWTAHQSEWHPYLCVCSEKSIDQDKREDRNIAHTYEIHGRVTTNPKEIRNFLTNNKNSVIYSTYQSLNSIEKAFKYSRIKFDLVICDEAHKTAGSKETEFSIIHNNKKIPAKKRLYMTATPRIVSEIVKNQYNKEIIKKLADMNDTDVFGPEFHRMSFAEAIKQKILVDYQIIAIGVTDKEVKKAIKERKYVSKNNSSIPVDEIANNYALQKVMKKYKAHHAITFHSSVSRAKQFLDRHKEIFPRVYGDHVNGQQTTNDRSLKLDEFRNEKKAIMTNARCLTEGIDVPAIDCVYFCDPKYSKIDIVQASGRALRLPKDGNKKKYGYIVVPIFHRDKRTLEKAVDESVFKSILNVVRALADQDERLEEEIRNIKLGKGVVPKRRKINLREIDGSINISLFELPNNLGNLLFDQIIEKTRIPWRDFEEAREFARSLKLKSASEWRDYLNGEFNEKPTKPDDIPNEPNSTYKEKGWKSWGDWLGTGEISTHLREYQNFKEARDFTRSLELNSFKEWLNYIKGEIKGKPLKPDDIPSNPQNTYKNKGWNGWGNWLGTGRIAEKFKIYKPYNEARKFVVSLSLSSYKEWIKYLKGEIKQKPNKPKNIPNSPQNTYKNKGWQGWGHWLGTGRIADKFKLFKPFKEAKEFARSLRLKSETEWRQYVKGDISGLPKKPDDIPCAPGQKYKNVGWKGMRDWLGPRPPVKSKYKSFIDAKKFVKKLGLKSSTDWSQYVKGDISGLPKKPDDIPIACDQAFKNKGWKSWGDWLGTGRVADHLKIYKPFKKARAFANSLDLKSQKEWFLYVKGDISGLPKKPDDIPSNPQNTYKNKGWESWGNWLGKK